MLLQEAVEDFLLSRKVGGATPATLDWYQRMLAALVGFCTGEGVTVPEAVTLAGLRRFVRYLLEERGGHGVKAVSANAYLRAVKVFLHYCHTEGYARTDSGARLPYLRADRLPLPTLTDAHLAALLEHWHGRSFTDSRNRCLVLFLLDTGCRGWVRR